MPAKKKTARKRARSPKPPETEALIPDMPSVFNKTDLVHLEKLAVTATPEEFQAASAMFFRKLLVRGLENVPVPRTIKEIQSIADLIRKAEGIDAKNGAPAQGLVAVRGFSRGRAKVVDAEEVDGGEGGPGESDAGEGDKDDTEPPEPTDDDLSDFEA